MRTERMGVRVRISDHLLRHTGGKAVIHLNGSTIREVLDHLITRHPAMQRCLFHPDNPNQVRHMMRLYLNGKEMRELQDLATPVQDGDDLAIVPDVP
jgi:molybdopterin converting factor small subunit